ncbi:MAG: cold shock and DUF1294 domain-containing protein [Aquabacterium sp.]
MNKTGKVIRWEADRGFGFIAGAAGTQDVFFHVKDVQRGWTPQVGQLVTYELVHVGGKGPCAVAVQGAASRSAGRVPTSNATPTHSRARVEPRSPTPMDPWLKPILLVALLWAAVLGWASATHRLPAWVVPAWLGLNLWTFVVYWRDKWAAQRGQWRTPESSLHVWSLLGGWPGARIAQQTLRHKSRKEAFQTIYWVTVLAHVAGVSGLLFGQARGWPL